MAIAYAIDPNPLKSRRDMGQTLVTITLDGSYSAGGYALSNAGLGMLDTPDNIEMNYVHATATNDFVPVYDRANNKIKIFCAGTASATLNECTSGQITSGHSIICTVQGRPVL
jgi:hypothetical protein